MTYSSVLVANKSSYGSSGCIQKSTEREDDLVRERYSLKSYNAEAKASSCTVEELIPKILKACIIKKQGIHPRKFCRRWFGLEKTKYNGQPQYREEQILAMESEHGYREKCINLLARLLKIKSNTIHRWGKGVKFDKIAPEKLIQYETYLGYIDTIRVMTTSFAEIDQEFLIRFSHNLSVK